MVRIMDLKSALSGLCYDTQLRLQSPETNPEDVLEWLKVKLAKTDKHYKTNKYFRSKEYLEAKKKPKKAKPYKVVKK